MTGATGVCAVSGFASPLVEGVAVAPGAGAVSAFTSSLDWGFACGTTACSGLRSGFGGPSRSIALWIRRNSMEGPIIPCPAGPEIASCQALRGPFAPNYRSTGPMCITENSYAFIALRTLCKIPKRGTSRTPQHLGSQRVPYSWQKTGEQGKGSNLRFVVEGYELGNTSATGGHDAVTRRDKT